MSESSEKLRKLTQVFNSLFLQTENTYLQTGAEEPFYQAATAESAAVIYSREDYFSSALHEIAHWCIAGKERRKLDDFGYWYNPEGRNPQQQHEFEKVEVKPQAVEWLLSMACEHPFHFSADNLSQGIDASDEFKANIEKQLQVYLANTSLNLPPRAALLFDRFNQVFRVGQKIVPVLPPVNLTVAEVSHV